MIPFIKFDERQKIFDRLSDYFSIYQENYCKLIAYYKKNWLYNKYINFSELENEEYLSRTNNYIENFHCNINKKLECFHPKISYLVTKYKEYLLSIYNKIKLALVNKINPKKEKFSIVVDILKFIKNLNDKYKEKICLNNILQCDDEDSKLISKIGNYLLDIFFDIEVNEKNLKEEIPNDDETLKLNEYSNNEKYISEKEEKNNELKDENLIFDEFYPKVVIKKKSKRSYLKAFGYENELKIFLNSLCLGSQKLKEI